jgi:serine/threonine protein kinase
MGVHIEANVEPVPGYRLIERLGGGGFGEVWKCEAPGGLHKAIKFVFGNLDIAGDSGQRAEQELKALSRVKTVRHPYILSLERYDIIDGQLIIIMELADRNLWDRYKESRNQGLLGIPREELLGYMNEAAEALDLMNNQYQLQHLDIKPQNLFLVHQHIKVADFGLVKDMEGSQASVTGGITPVYAAPETFDGKVTRFSDQYSLAIVFQELLTGIRPFAGANVRQLIVQHLQAEPNLAPLEPRDRPVVYRALNKQPDKRYPSCIEFVRALQEGRRGESQTPAAQHGPAPAPTRESRTDPNPTPRERPSRPTSDSDLRRGSPPPASVPEEAQTASNRRWLDGKPVEPAWQRVPGAAPGSRDVGVAPTHFIGVPGAAEESNSAGPTPVQAAPFVPSRAVDSPSRRLQEKDGGGALYPVVLVGVGGVGAQVLEAFRGILGEQFGTPELLPHIRTLLIDTDPEVLRRGGLPASCVSGPEDVPPTPFALQSPDLLLAPLNRPSHYLKPRGGRVAPESWLNQRMLYLIPREQLTKGVRALGRLALFDHFPTIRRRLQMELEACCDFAALEHSAATTKLGVRTCRPRIILVSSLMGGTGSGMFLDLAYLMRSLLRQIGHADPHVTGLLFIPHLKRRKSSHARNRPGAADGSSHGPRPSAQGKPAVREVEESRALALGNANAALRELQYYSRLDTEFQARYLEREPGLYDADGPFNPSFLLPLSDGPLRRESQETIGMAARFLAGECVSAFGRWRGPGIDAAGASLAQQEPTYRTFGMYRVSFPRRQVVQQAVSRVLRAIIERWMSKNGKPLEAGVREWVNEQWRGQELGAEHFISRVKEACEKRLGKEPEAAFLGILQPLAGKLGDNPGDARQGFLSRVRGGGAAAPMNAEEVLDILVQYQELLGRPEILQENGGFKAADWNGAGDDPSNKSNAPEMMTRLPDQREVPPGSLMLALRETATAIANEWSQKLAELPVKLIEQPAFRLAGAEEAVRQVVQGIEQVLDRHESLGHELADRAAQAYGQLLGFVKLSEGTHSWPRNGPGPDKVLEWLRVYAKSRYQSLVLQQVLGVYVSLRGCLTDELREINFCRVRLQEMCNQLGAGQGGGEDSGQHNPPPLATRVPTREGRGRHLFPAEWADLNEAVEKIVAGLSGEDLLGLDERLQKMIRGKFVALVNICMSSKNMTRDVLNALREVASGFVEERLGDRDVSRLFLDCAGSESAAAEDLLICYEEAVPEPASTARKRGSRPKMERSVLAMSPGPGAEKLRALATQKLGDDDLMLAECEDDVILYREWSDLLLADVDPLGPAGQEAYDLLSSKDSFTPHTRNDVPFDAR